MSAGQEESNQPLMQIWYAVWQFMLLGHATLATAWMWVMPGGFPINHLRFWANRGLPAMVVAMSLAGIYCSFRKRQLVSSIVIFIPISWAFGAISSRVVFPISVGALWRFGFLIGLLLGGLAFEFRRKTAQRIEWRLALAMTVLAMANGILLAIAQRAPDPDTLPWNGGLPSNIQSSSLEVPSYVEINSNLGVEPIERRVEIKCGSLKLSLRPILAFVSRSPDRCWTILSPERYLGGPQTELKAYSFNDSLLQLRYESDFTSLLIVQRGGNAEVIESYSHLKQPIYSHLNSFCELIVEGHQKLSFTFSPCPDVPIEARPADYPTGRPGRLAYLDRKGVFQIVEASSGEKGPYRSLAEGALTRHNELAITIPDEGAPVCEITFSDWAAQAGMTLSPTAGWGLPVNAIEFRLLGDGPQSAAALSVTLAGTSVGRGWDTVGHSAGIYRNRIRVEELS